MAQKKDILDKYVDKSVYVDEQVMLLDEVSCNNRQSKLYFKLE